MSDYYIATTHTRLGVKYQVRVDGETVTARFKEGGEKLAVVEKMHQIVQQQRLDLLAAKLRIFELECKVRKLEDSETVADPAINTLAKQIMGWWEDHQYDTHMTDDGPINLYYEDPDFVVTAKNILAKGGA